MLKHVLVLVGKKLVGYIIDLALVTVASVASAEIKKKFNKPEYEPKQHKIVFLNMDYKGTYVRQVYETVFLCMTPPETIPPDSRIDAFLSKYDIAPPKIDEETPPIPLYKVAEEDLERILGTFVARYKGIVNYGEKVFSYKEILCSLGGDLETISPKISLEKRLETARLGKFLNGFVLDEASAELTAGLLYTSIINRVVT